ncbi:DUF1292 domain-containing protein [Clostridium coskatii]|uniref:Uncharacterized protein n=1 Tax=Clostridium coskatii TaxID=1705578 RepID=A0A162J0K9_9CLOT|nr:DUF1292 domain-containing protein [Clostridium coskatii]OAA86045.1 hypothetical protein WX73_03126 [Clostridium coskatii]OBR91592.1 hypothetical protein CLCOS_33680 [Clostridium coskatii]
MDNNAADLILEDENGKKVKFQVVTKFDIKEEEYIIAVPEECVDEDTAIALKIVKDDNGEEVLVTVEDEDEFDKVLEVYESLFGNEA